MNIALILFALPLIAITFLIVNNILLYNNKGVLSLISGGECKELKGRKEEKEKKEYYKSIRPRYQMILKEKKDIIISLILSIKNLLIIIIALL